MSKGLKILFITQHWPMAPAYGAQQRVLNTARLLSRFGQVSFVMVTVEPLDGETVRRTKNEFELCRIIRPIRTAPGAMLHRVRNRLRRELDPGYLATDQWEVTDSDRSALLELMQEHDLVWVRSVTAANWCGIDRWPRSVLDADDLPSRFYWLSAQSGGNPLRRLVDLRRSWVWRRRELLFTRRFNVVAVCSENDRRYLGSHAGIHVIPNGFDPLPTTRCVSSKVPRIGFIGLFKYSPNVNGVKWFVSKAWPLIKREIAHVQLRLVGRGSDGYLAGLGPDVVGLGWMEDPGEEIASWSAMIVPIKAGAGTRVKIAEGFARKCPVVATSVGAFGYDVRDGEEILLANRADQFASACIRLLRDPQLGEALSERAHLRFLREWTWDSYEGSVGTVLQECLARDDRPQVGKADPLGATEVI